MERAGQVVGSVGSRGGVRGEEEGGGGSSLLGAVVELMTD